MRTNEKYKRIRRFIAWGFITFAIGMLLLIWIVERNGLTEWRDPITLIVRIYTACIFIVMSLILLIPTVWDYFNKKDKSDE